MIHKSGSRAMVRALVRRIRILSETRQNTYQARKALRSAFNNRFA